VISDEVLKCFA